MSEETKPAEAKRTKRSKKNRKKIHGARLFILGLCFFTIILLIVFFSSSLSRVQQIEVKGNQLIDSKSIIQFSNIKIGNQYLFLWESDVREAVKKLGSIEQVTLEKEFPGLVRIVVKEYPNVAYIELTNNKWDLVLANGKRLPTNSVVVPDKPMLSGWNEGPANALLPKLTAALLQVKPEHLQDISQIVPIPTKTYADKIRMYTRSGYEVVSTITLFPKKIEFLQGVIRDTREKKQLSGTIFLLETIYHRPFQVPKEEKMQGTTQIEN
jgi:cell division protein FtsQ